MSAADRAKLEAVLVEHLAIADDVDVLIDLLYDRGAVRDEAIVKAEALEEEASRTYRKGGDDYPFAASEVAAFLNERARRVRAGESS